MLRMLRSVYVSAGILALLVAASIGIWGCSKQAGTKVGSGPEKNVSAGLNKDMTPEKMAEGKAKVQQMMQKGGGTQPQPKSGGPG